MPMPDETPSLEVLAEKVRSRLTAHGQHGALADFSAYEAAVQEQLSAPSLLEQAIHAAELPATLVETAPKAKKAKASK